LLPVGFVEVYEELFSLVRRSLCLLWEAVLITALPTKVAVLYPIEPDELIVVPEWVRRKDEECRGGPVEWRGATVVSVGRAVKYQFGLCAGDSVGLRMNAPGITLEHSDRPEDVPVGYELRLIHVFDTISVEGADPILFKVSA
jgi:hypothetical protein